MFSWASDASKVGLVYLARHLHAWGYPLIDCQLPSPHIESLGAELIPRRRFMDALARYCSSGGHPAPWRVDTSLDVATWRPAEADKALVRPA
jgi:leucyl/phenylalanyl-tRNA---protein transferase